MIERLCVGTHQSKSHSMYLTDTVEPVVGATGVNPDIIQ